MVSEQEPAGELAGTEQNQQAKGETEEQMPGNLLSLFLRLLRDDGRCRRFVARRSHHGVGGLRRFHRRVRDLPASVEVGSHRHQIGALSVPVQALAPAARLFAPLAHEPAAPLMPAVADWLYAGPAAPTLHIDPVAPVEIVTPPGNDIVEDEDEAAPLPSPTPTVVEVGASRALAFLSTPTGSAASQVPRRTTPLRLRIYHPPRQPRLLLVAALSPSASRRRALRRAAVPPRAWGLGARPPSGSQTASPTASSRAPCSLEFPRTRTGAGGAPPAARECRCGGVLPGGTGRPCAWVTRAWLGTKRWGISPSVALLICW
ncbi:uncharacterized protein [Triticum aestivum]|uniref:uncharacterized protein n=1 Tax=Triticum aestivum TaxID=4565 RepID=UPI001D011F41|nr:uncharacterized protein LOC123053155 [Triticum aestivum]